MLKNVLFVLFALSLTACNEHNSATPALQQNNVAESVVSPMALPSSDSSTPGTFIDIPVLEDENPSSMTASTPTQQSAHTQTYSGGSITDGLDIGTIRLSNNNNHNRLVFDSYKWNIHTKNPTVKSNHSGHYTFKYDAAQKCITVIIEGYRGFSALNNAKKERIFTNNNMIEKIALNPYDDDSGYKFTIKLKQNAQVKVFDLKEPGRIIVDILPL